MLGTVHDDQRMLRHSSSHNRKWSLGLENGLGTLGWVVKMNCCYHLGLAWAHIPLGIHSLNQAKNIHKKVLQLVLPKIYFFSIFVVICHYSFSTCYGFNLTSCSRSLLFDGANGFLVAPWSLLEMPRCAVDDLEDLKLSIIKISIQCSLFFCFRDFTTRFSFTFIRNYLVLFCLDWI